MSLVLDLSLKPLAASAEPAPAVKDCTKCGETKALEAFSPDRSKSLGRYGQCKPCVAARKAGRRNDPEVRADEYSRNQVYKRARRQDPARRDNLLTNQRRYNATYRAKNPEALRQSDQRRRARKRQAPIVPFTEADLFAAWDEAELYACYWCDCDLADGMHIDHLVPLAKGGAHAIHNLVPSCADCNLSKNDKDPDAFALERHPWLADFLTSSPVQG